MWKNYQDGEIQITRSIWKGHITEPKTRKGRGAIPVIAPLAKRLEFHRAGSGNPKSGVMFPNLNGSPMDLGNLLNRAMLPALNRCAVCGKPKEECRKLGKGKDSGPDHEFVRDKILPEWHGWHAARRDWERTCTALAYRKKRFRPSFAMLTCPRPTRTTSRVQRMTPAQRWRS